MPIEVKNLVYIYDQGMPFEKKALDDITLSIEDSKITGIIGSTGSGKSTLIQHFNALLVPTSGKVTVDGIDIADKKTNKKQLRQKVGLVFQYPEAQLFGETVIQDVTFGPQKAGLPKEQVEFMAKNALKLVGLDPETYAQRSPFKLSGGEKRKVAIAGILACKPQILVLDEPTAGLDPHSRIVFLDLVKTFKTQGSTLIIVSHDMDEIARITDNVIILSQGKLLFSGPTSEAFSRPQMIAQAGVDVPALSNLAERLRLGCIDLPRKTYTPDELVMAIISKVGNK